MKKFLARFVKDESGATAIEYGLIATGIAVAIIGGSSLLGTSLDGMFRSIAATLGGGSSSGGGS